MEEELCAEGEEDQPVKWCEEGPSEEEVMHIDKGEALVIHRSLNTIMGANEED